jgi:hypothetical protein
MGALLLLVALAFLLAWRWVEGFALGSLPLRVGRSAVLAGRCAGALR